ncbi:hypothetical protein N183_38175 [Sinorhizobium sp. Sb3]|uniref:hypothetical protein n=1 Tax=Sinorhizobium sp. Sb3 TaxID=1358417 RepID=UPI00071C489E|nr:hypothetical protein [Sinorhizobium sp. Sb3]KSV83462.1 hypothetical protein N183_38175 [Sinorhizobium sp. Sb3]
MSIASRGRILGKLFGCLVLFAAHESLAEVLVDPDVMAVVEGGYWREDGVGEGSYRIIVVRQGFEHVSSRVVAEWKLAANEKGRARIIHSVELVKGGFYSVGAPEIEFSKGGARVELGGTATFAPGTTVVCHFALAPGGKVTVLKACGD